MVIGWQRLHGANERILNIRIGRRLPDGRGSRLSIHIEGPVSMRCPRDRANGVDHDAAGHRVGEPSEILILQGIAVLASLDDQSVNRAGYQITGMKADSPWPGTLRPDVRLKSPDELRID